MGDTVEFKFAIRSWTDRLNGRDRVRRREDCRLRQPTADGRKVITWEPIGANRRTVIPDALNHMLSFNFGESPFISGRLRAPPPRNRFIHWAHRSPQRLLVLLLMPTLHLQRALVQGVCGAGSASVLAARKVLLLVHFLSTIPRAARFSAASLARKVARCCHLLSQDRGEHNVRLTLEHRVNNVQAMALPATGRATPATGAEQASATTLLVSEIQQAQNQASKHANTAQELHWGKAWKQAVEADDRSTKPDAAAAVAGVCGDRGSATSMSAGTQFTRFTTRTKVQILTQKVVRQHHFRVRSVRLVLLQAHQY